VERQRFAVTAADDGGRLIIVVPFDPDQIWKDRPQHRITGAVNAMGVRGVLEPR
jgi:hypothetical protein